MNQRDIDWYVSAIDRDGYAVVPAVLLPDEIEALVSDEHAVFSRYGRMQTRRGGIRSLFALWPAAIELARSAALRRWVTPILGDPCFAVRAILFDKTPEANWKVAWHQDLSIAVREKVPADGFGPWSVKDEISHVQPPVAVLERMLTVRLHMDDCGEDQGPLRVLPGSHRHGRLSEDEIRRRSQGQADACAAEACLVPRGGIVVMRPLLLHASSAASAPSRRRVLHLEYAAESLPGGVEWHERW